MLPHDVLWRKKDPFFNGCGMTKFFEMIASEITDEEFAQARIDYPKVKLTHKAVLYLYKIFLKYYGESGSERDIMGYYPYGDDLLADIHTNGFNENRSV